MKQTSSIPLNDQAIFQFISGLWKADRAPVIHSAVLRSTNFRLDGLLDYSDIAELNVDCRQFAQRRLMLGDIIVERSGGGPKQPVGRVGYFDPTDNRSYCTSNFTTAIRVIDTNTFDPRYVSLFLHALYLSGATETLQRATTGIRNLDWNEYLKFRVPNAPLLEQQAAVCLIDGARRTYILEEQQINVFGEIKRVAMRELFTRGLRGEAQKETENGFIPESWKVAIFGDLFEIKHGFAFDGNFFRSTGEFTLLTPGHFAEEGGFRGQGEKTKYFVGEIPTEFVLHEGDLLVAMTEQKAGLLGSAVLIPRHGKFLHNQRLGLVAGLNDSRLTRRYLYHLFSSASVRADIARTATGSKVRHTSPGRIKEIAVALPTPMEQQEIVAILDGIDRKIDLHKRKRTVLEELFKTLLHKLMTGEIRVADLDMSALQSHTTPETAA